MPDAIAAARPVRSTAERTPIAWTRAEWLALALGVLVAHAFLVHEWLYPSSYDAGLYAKMGREIADHGLIQPYSASDYRTYGYPLFLSLVHRLSDTTRLPFVGVLFGIQLLAFAGACVLFRNALAPLSARAARIAFCAMVANYYVLIYLPESLTESLTIVLLLAAGACWLRAYCNGATITMLAAGGVAAGFSVMVRPANLFIVIAWVAGLVVVACRRTPSPARALLNAAIVATAIGLPALPQLVNNTLFHGKRTPLVVADLGSMQVVWGIRDIKYATGMPPVPVAALHYVNPMWPGTTIGERAPWRWYVDNAWRGPLTLALHAFNLTDQDLLFTYSRDLDPWYRIPLGIVNHALVALGVAGLWLTVRRVRRGPAPARDALLVLAVLLGANLCAYAWTAVEMRFGSVLLLILAPFACDAALRAGRTHWRARLASTVGVAAYVMLALAVSDWVRAQCEAIRALSTAGG